MNKFFCIAVFLLGIFSITAVNAQFALKRHSICASGGSWKGTIGSVQYVVGTPGSLSDYSGNYHLTPGFIQPFNRKNEKIEGVEITAFPSPVKRNLNIKIISDTPAYYAVDIFDISGKRVEVVHPVFVSDYYLHVINFSSYEQGLYFLRITGKGGSFQKSLKIEKIQ